MGLLEDKVNELEESGHCPVCLTTIDSGSHNACRVFSGTDVSDTRSRISIDLLNKYRGDWRSLSTIGLYSALVPWDLDRESLAIWFSNIEDAMIKIENGETSSSKIVRFFDNNRQHLYPLRRVMTPALYSFDHFFKNWDIDHVTTPLDFVISKKLNGDCGDVGTFADLPWRDILTSLFTGLFDQEPDFENTHPGSWSRMRATGRRILYNDEEDVVVSARTVNDRVLVSSCFTISGKWLGWGDWTTTWMTAPSIKDLAPPQLVRSGHILTNWDKLIKRGAEANQMRQIIRAHGMSIVGEPDVKMADIRAMRSHAEIMDDTHSPIWNVLQPTPEARTASNVTFSDHEVLHDEQDLERRANEFISQYTPFPGPKSKIQGRAIGWILTHQNTVVELVMPTGSGKSLLPLCTAINGYLESKDGVAPLTVVVCPMIALIDDQVELAKRSTTFYEFSSRKGRIIALHSLKEENARGETLSFIADGTCSLLFLTAEQLQMEGIIQQLSRRTLNWLFIDEAHSIIEFRTYRPAYNRLWYPIERLKLSSPRMGIVAQTATLPPGWSNALWERLLRTEHKDTIKVFRSTEIRKNLHFENPVILKSGEGCHRNELSIDKAVTNVLKGKRTILYSLFKDTEGYFNSMYRNLVDRLPGKVVGCYSGNGSKIDGQEISKDEFVRRFSQGEIDLVLATMAFGLGIDRKDIEAIVLNGMPANLNLLYQQAGRAARDSDLIGHIFVFSEPQQDFRHQMKLASQTHFHATTTTRHLQRMLFSRSSKTFGNGLYLLDLTSQDKGDEYETNLASAVKNKRNALRILSDADAIELIAILPDSITIRKDLATENLGKSSAEFWDNAKYTDLEDDLIEVPVTEYLSYILSNNKTILGCLQTAEELSNAMMESGTRISGSQRYALIGWLWTRGKRDLEEKLASNKVENGYIKYQEEERLARQFLYARDVGERLKIISEYYGFCGLNCTGCQGCE